MCVWNTFVMFRESGRGNEKEKSTCHPIKKWSEERKRERERKGVNERGKMCVSYTFCGSSIFSVLDEFE